jgi:dihydroorotate dehydrogenase/NAD-dependent dihydropyrimidine dehydrogenase PreA subunit
MRNPIGIGSVAMPLITLHRLTPEIHANVLLKHIDAGAGYVVLPICINVPRDLLADLKKRAKPMRTQPEPPTSKFMRMETKGLGLSGLYFFISVAGPPEDFPGIRQLKEMIEILKSTLPKGVPIIGNCGGLGAFPETYVSTAKSLEKVGCDLIEVNVGCALSANMENAVDDYFDKNFPLYFAGGLVGDQPDLVEEITRQVVNAVKIPVGVKLSPETGFPRIVEVARRIKKAGGKFANCSNNAVVVPPPNIYNEGKSSFPFMGDNFFCAGSGNFLRQIVYKQVTGIAKYVPELDIICTGGLTVPEHVVEAMMLGANVTQFVTAMMYESRNTIKKNVAFLKSYMKEQGYKSVDEFRGLALRHFKPSVDIDFKLGKIYAEIDATKCNGCRLCVNQICCATYMEDKVARVEVEKCLGCGMCVALCPQGAPQLYEKP